jgi:peroxiredoxin
LATIYKFEEMTETTMSMNRPNLIVFLFIAITSFSIHASYDISLESTDERNHTLSEYIGHGNWVVLNIWGARCPPCREEAPELVSFHDEHSSIDAIVVGIAIDFPSYGHAKKDEVSAFADDHLIDFPLLLSDSSITEKSGLGRLDALPTTYLFNPEGEVVGMHVGVITKKMLEEFIKRMKLRSPPSSNDQ